MNQRLSTHSLAYLGECFVQWELAKRDYKLLRTHGFGYDFIGQNNFKIEVKSALPSQNTAKKRSKTYSYKYWQFRLSNKAQEKSDFYPCVVFDQKEALPLTTFIFPRDQITTLGRSNMLCVFESDINGCYNNSLKINKNIFRENWGLITLNEENNKTEEKEGSRDLLSLSNF